MSCTQHDVYAANSQFLTHLVGRMLGSVGDLRSTPIDTKGFASILQVVETTCDDSFDLFYGLYRYNQHSKSTLLCLRKAMADLELRLISSELDGAGRGRARHARLPGRAGARLERERGRVERGHPKLREKWYFACSFAAMAYSRV